MCFKLWLAACNKDICTEGVLRMSFKKQMAVIGVIALAVAELGLMFNVFQKAAVVIASAVWGS